MRRKQNLETNQIYHIYASTVNGREVFHNVEDYDRFKNLLFYYSFAKTPVKFSRFLQQINSHSNLLSGQLDASLSELVQNNETALSKSLTWIHCHEKEEKNVSVISYCVLPSQIHLVLKQERKNGISKFMSNVLNSYARYINIKNNTQGSVWSSRFKSESVQSADELLLLTKLIHKKPVDEQLAKSIDEWNCSSYQEFINQNDSSNTNMSLGEHELNFPKLKIIHHKNLMQINSSDYKKFISEPLTGCMKILKLKSLMKYFQTDKNKLNE